MTYDKNVDATKDAMLLISYQLQTSTQNADAVSPTIIDFRLFSMNELIAARDKRLTDAGGRWFGNYETPGVISKAGRAKLAKKVDLDTTVYGRKESEGRDFNEDTNFGKLKRIPHPDLQAFLRKCINIGVGQEDSPIDEEDEHGIPEPKPTE